MSRIYRDQAVGLVRELKKTEDGIRGTMGWIEPKVRPDVYTKMKTVIRQSIRYGAIKHALESTQFNDGLDKELGND